MKIWQIKALLWPVAMYGCESWTLKKNQETHLDIFEMKGLRKILLVLWTAKKTNEWVLNKAGVKKKLLKTVKAQKLAYHEKTRKLPGERDNARNNARCMQTRKITHGLDGQHQYVDRAPHGTVNQNDSGQRYMERVCPWCGQPSDWGRLKNRTYGTASHHAIIQLRNQHWDLVNRWNMAYTGHGIWYGPASICPSIHH